MTTAYKPIVWVVEDQEEVSLLVETILTSAGYEAKRARNGLEALEMLQSGDRPDLILLDIIMPKMDGFEFLGHFQRNYDAESIPVVMLTALGKGTDVIKSMKRGATDYCVKPIDPDDVIATVQRCLAPTRGVA